MWKINFTRLQCHCDNVDMCTYVFPELTTISQLAFEIGQQATHIILDRLIDPQKN